MVKSMLFKKKQPQKDAFAAELKEMMANVESLLEMITDLNERLRSVEYALTDRGLLVENRPPIDERGEGGLLREATEFVKKRKKISVSVLQKRFKISYVRAFNLLRVLEEDKVIGGYRGTGERVVNKT